MREIHTTDELDRMTPDEAYAITARQLGDSIGRWLSRSGVRLLWPEPQEPRPRLHSVREISAEMGISERSLYRNAARGLIKSTRLGRRVMFLRQDVARYLKGRTSGSGQ